MRIIKVSKKYLINTWIFRLPLTIWIYKKVFFLGRVKGEQEISFRGRRFLVNTKDITLVPALINQDFEVFEIDLFENILSPGMTILDIGANIGVYSVIGSKLVEGEGKLYAFEPVPENIEMLRHNLRLNDASNVQVVECAVGEKPGKVDITIAEDSIGTHFIGAATPTNSITVSVNTIDDFVEAHGLKVDVIKMDIEGYEGYAINGALRTFKDEDLKLMTEFSADFIKRSGKDPTEVARQLLATFKYCYSIDERKRSIFKIEDVEGLLNRKNNNFLLTNKPYSLGTN